MGRIDEAVPKKDVLQNPIIEYPPIGPYPFGVMYFGGGYVREPLRGYYPIYYERMVIRWWCSNEYIQMLERVIGNRTARNRLDDSTPNRLEASIPNRLEDSTHNHLATLIYSLVDNATLNNGSRLHDNDWSTKPGD